MSRKDYVLIAAALRAARPNMPICKPQDFTDEMVSACHRDIASEIADALQRDNPRFSRERFLEAAGVRV